MLGKGATNLEIAESLYISVNTVKVHVHNILDKLSLSNRRQAGLLARNLMLTNSLKEVTEISGLENWSPKNIENN
jgi:DNA-binding NarL/FixJ family response regulator